MQDARRAEDDDGNLSLAVQALDVLGAAARERRTKSSVRSAGRGRGVGVDRVMSVRVMTAEELLHGKMRLRYVLRTDRGVDATDAVYFRPDATELVGELHGGGGTYCLQVAVEGYSAATVEAVVAVERKVHRALQAVDEATQALALQAMAQFRQTLAVGAWQNVPVLCGLEVQRRVQRRLCSRGRRVLHRARRSTSIATTLRIPWRRRSGMRRTWSSARMGAP